MKEMCLEASAEDLVRGKSHSGKTTTCYKRQYLINENGEIYYRMYLGVDGGNPYQHLICYLKKC